MTLEAMTMDLAAAYERAIYLAQSPGEVAQIRSLLGRAFELLRTVATAAIQHEQRLKPDPEAYYRHALKTAGDPRASWPPPVVVRLQPGDRL